MIPTTPDKTETHQTNAFLKAAESFLATYTFESVGPLVSSEDWTSDGAKGILFRKKQTMTKTRNRRYKGLVLKVPDQ